jgi:uncharacterized lipoprotein YehR (DUF1307 family)
MTANEARKLTAECNSSKKEYEAIIQKIKEKASEGQYHITLDIEDINVAKLLETLGYKLEFQRKQETYTTYKINWNE